jgi:hypothetical protein
VSRPFVSVSLAVCDGSVTWISNMTAVHAAVILATYSAGVVIDSPPNAERFYS